MLLRVVIVCVQKRVPRLSIADVQQLIRNYSGLCWRAELPSSISVTASCRCPICSASMRACSCCQRRFRAHVMPVGQEVLKADVLSNSSSNFDKEDAVAPDHERLIQPDLEPSYSPPSCSSEEAPSNSSPGGLNVPEPDSEHRDVPQPELEHIDTTIVRMRGLPRACTVKELKDFLADDCAEGIVNVHFMYFVDGTQSGIAFVEFKSKEYVEKALLKHQTYFGKTARYVQIYRSSADKLAAAREACGGRVLQAVKDCIVRVYGFPRTVTNGDVTTCFAGLNVAPQGILILRPDVGSPEVFVKFVDEESTTEALKRHSRNTSAGQRFLEIFPRSEEQVKLSIERFEMMVRRSSQWRYDDPYSDQPPHYPGAEKFSNDNAAAADQDQATDIVCVKGFDFHTTSDDILEFFNGLNIYPHGITLSVDRLGRTFAFVRFATIEDAIKARSRHLGFLRRRYLEVYTVTKQQLNRAKQSSSIDCEPATASSRSSAAAPRLPVERYHQDRQFSSIRSNPVLNPYSLQHSSESQHLVRMCGLPSSASVASIIDFFRPIPVKTVRYVLDSRGRPCGNADVEFYTHSNAADAVKRDGAWLGTNRVELFLESSASSNGYRNPRQGPNYSTPPTHRRISNRRFQPVIQFPFNRLR